jgi:hypothetical protein
MPPPPAPTLVAANDSNSLTVDLPERPSPDGGEDHIPTSDDETEAWSDWDVTDNAVSCHACRHVHKVPASDSYLRHICPCGITRLPVDNFQEIMYWVFLLISLEKIHVYLKSGKHKTDTSHEDPQIFMTTLVSNITMVAFVTRVTSVSVIAVVTNITIDILVTMLTGVPVVIFATMVTKVVSVCNVCLNMPDISCHVVFQDNRSQFLGTLSKAKK